MLLVSLVSANLAYRGDYPIGGVSIGEIASGRDAVLEGLRGVRGTSAAWAAAWAALFLAVVVRPLPPGRRRDVVGHPRLGPRPRRGGGRPRAVPHVAGRARARPLVILVVVLVALLLDVKRLTGPR